MPITLKSLETLLPKAMGEDFHFAVDADDGVIRAAFRTNAYRDGDGEPNLYIELTPSSDGDLLSISAPHVYNLRGCPHPFAACRALLGVCWRVNSVRFELDQSDGEVRASYDLRIHDGTLTADQLENSIRCLLAVINRYHESIHSAMTTGHVAFPDEPVLESVLAAADAPAAAGPATPVDPDAVVRELFADVRLASKELWTKAKPSDDIVSRW